MFLHQRALSTPIIAGYIASSRSEDEQLDFKAIPWKAGEGLEAAKDIAAFANQLGGDIILGVSDKADCAAGWVPIQNADLTKIGSNIRQWLINHIRPHQFAEAVEIESVPSPTPNESVITVSVPPSADLVGVEHRNGDKITLQFPIRIGKRTRWLTFDEVMNRASNSTRGTYIKLKSIESNLGNGAPVRFSNPVLIPYSDSYVEGKLIEGSHGVLLGVYEDIIIVEIKVVDTGNNNLAIPLELIRSMWVQPRSGMTALLSIALDAKIVLGDSRWRLFTSV